MMRNTASGRVQREFQEIPETDESNIKVKPVNNSWTELRAEIGGPPETPYEGGTFILEIKVPRRYPFRPPKVRFISKIWHPNISYASGAIRLDILRQKWDPVMSLRTVLLSVQALLDAAVPHDPLDVGVAVQCSYHHSIFLRTARHWTNVYAAGPHNVPDFDAKIERLKQLGVDEDTARAKLSINNWDWESTVESMRVNTHQQ